MIADHLTGIEQFGADLWKMADDLRANSGLASNEYFMPIMGLLFLRQATNRYNAALAAIEADKERLRSNSKRSLKTLDANVQKATKAAQLCYQPTAT